MSKPGIDKAFTKLHGLLQSVSPSWIIIGTSSLYLQGYPVTPNDVDILCNEDAAIEIEQILYSFRLPDPEFISRDKFRSRFSRYRIAGVDVELMGGLQVHTPDGWADLLSEIEHAEYVVLNGCQFPTPSKSDQLKIYEFFGREKDNATLAMLRGLR